MNEEIKRALILENYQNPKNRGLVDDDTYLKINTNSKSCIDEIDLQMKIQDGMVKDMRFEGEACAICTSSTSILINTLIGKKIEEALEIIKNFENMIEEKEYKSELIGEALAYSDIAKQPNRKNCALLTWRGAKDIIIESRK